jgi:hypothetical protein
MPEEDTMSAPNKSIRAFGAVIVLSTLTAITARGVEPQATSDRDAQILEDFKKRVHEYVLLHQKLEAGIGKLPDKATPQQIDTFQRELGKAVVAARANAKQGDVFGPEASALIKRLFVTVFTGPHGARIKKEINDEPHPAVPAVNARYPDDVPLSTMPPDVLKVLPTLEEEIEYRFIGRHLILLDSHAHMVVDLVPNAIPA